MNPRCNTAIMHIGSLARFVLFSCKVCSLVSLAVLLALCAPCCSLCKVCSLVSDALLVPSTLSRVVCSFGLVGQLYCSSLTSEHRFARFTHHIVCKPWDSQQIELPELQKVFLSNEKKATSTTW